MEIAITIQKKQDGFETLERLKIPRRIYRRATPNPRLLHKIHLNKVKLLPVTPDQTWKVFLSELETKAEHIAIRIEIKTT